MDTRFSSAIHTLILVAEAETLLSSEQIAGSVGTNASYIYQAVNDMEEVCLFDLHQNANDQCVVGRYIKPVLTDMFAEIETAFARELAGKTLADCIGAIRKELIPPQKISPAFLVPPVGLK